MSKPFRKEWNDYFKKFLVENDVREIERCTKNSFKERTEKKPVFGLYNSRGNTKNKKFNRDSRKFYGEIKLWYIGKLFKESIIYNFNFFYDELSYIKSY